MTDVLLDYGLFLAQSITVVVAVALIVAVIAEKMMPPKAFKSTLKAQKKARKTAARQAQERPRIFVLDFRGDIRASGGRDLREEVSAVLGAACEGDEVLVRLENSGGLVHEHGFAASQLARLKAQDVKLTVAVDKVAASGGYMMACIADCILAAPFAVLGSIGVIAQLPNAHRLLKEHGVDFELFKGGRYKRTVTLFGENTDEDRQKFQQEIDEAHTLFKQFVGEHRPSLDLDRVGTGEHWFGRDALSLGLCDALGTSDDWLMARREGCELLHVRYRRRETVTRRLAHAVEDAPARALERLLARVGDRHLHGG
jgi:serine protease SohB